MSHYVLFSLAALALLSSLLRYMESSDFTKKYEKESSNKEKQENSMDDDDDAMRL